MSRKTVKILFLLFLPFLTVSCLKKEAATETAEPQLAKPTKVLDYLALSAQFLVNQQQSDGFFKYEYDFITGNYTAWDNIVHQAQAGYVLSKYYSFLIRNNIDPHRAVIIRESVNNALKGYTAVSLARKDAPGQLLSFYYNKSGSISGLEPNPERFTPEYRKQRLDAEIVATAFAFMTELTYWESTSDTAYADMRAKWREALIYHTKKALESGSQESSVFLPELWLAFAYYDRMEPNDPEIPDLLKKMDVLFLASPRSISDLQDYTWDMTAAYTRYQKTNNPALAEFAARQTMNLLENIYTQHDTTVNSCALSLGLVEASLALSRDPSYSRIEKTALGRSQLEYYSSLKYMILPDQTWIALGPGRTLHSQEFKRFAGAYVYGQHMPRTNIELSEMCLLTGMRFSNEDIKELKQQH